MSDKPSIIIIIIYKAELYDNCAKTLPFSLPFSCDLAATLCACAVVHMHVLACVCMLVQQ